MYLIIMSFHWDDETVLLLIQKFHENDILWNLKNPDYKNRNKRTDTLNVIASVFETNISEIERKLKNLTCQYFRERKKLEESRRSGALDEVRQPKWFAYKALDFLRDKKRSPGTGENSSSKWDHPTSGSAGNTIKFNKINQNSETSQDSPVLDDEGDEVEDPQERMLQHFSVHLPQSSRGTEVGSSSRNKRVANRKLVGDTNRYMAQKRKLTLDLLNHDIYLRKLQALKLETELGIGRSEYTQELEAGAVKIKTENTFAMEFDY